jgi:hypothetical protein
MNTLVELYLSRKGILRAFFRIVNRLIIVPAFQVGLGGIISNPITGNIMVLGITGRKTGVIRYTPVSYARRWNMIYCYRGREMQGQWYLNLLANPRLEIILPDGRFSGLGEEVMDSRERVEAMRLLMQGSGLSSSLNGFDPSKASDEVVAKKIQGIAVIRITLD